MVALVIAFGIGGGPKMTLAGIRPKILHGSVTGRVTYERTTTFQRSDVSPAREGTASILASPPSVCVVQPGTLTVHYVGTGKCVLRARITVGNRSRTGPEQFQWVLPARRRLPKIEGVPQDATVHAPVHLRVNPPLPGTWVTASPRRVCWLGTSDKLNLNGSGPCTLTVHVPASKDYLALDSPDDRFTVHAATTTPPATTTPQIIGGLSPTATYETYMQFQRSDVSPAGEGTASILAFPPSVCVVVPGTLTVHYVGTGVCVLRALITVGNQPLTGPEQFQRVLLPPKSRPLPIIENVPGWAQVRVPVYLRLNPPLSGVSITASPRQVCWLGTSDKLNFNGPGPCTLTVHVPASNGYPAAVKTQTFTVHSAVE